MMPTEKIVQVCNAFLAGPGPAFCFYNLRWWRYDDGFWTQSQANAHVVRAIRAVALDMCEGSPDWRCRQEMVAFLTTTNLNHVKRELSRRLEVIEGIPARLNPVSTDLDAVPAPPAAPGPADPPVSGPPGTLPSPERADPAGTPSPAGPGA